MRILFVCGADLSAASEKQALWFARELCGRGHRVMICLYGDRATERAEGADRIEGLEAVWQRFAGHRPRRWCVERARGLRPTLIHAWSSRLPVVAATRAYTEATDAPVLVHWEDSEWALLEGLPHRSLPRRTVHLARRIASQAHPPWWHFSTRASLAWATENALAFDALTPALAEEVRARTGRECAVILPPLPASAWDGAGRAGPQLPPRLDGTELALFTGDIHFAAAPDVRLALEAIAAVQARGLPIAFVHAGRNTSGMDVVRQAERAGMEPGTAVVLGDLPFERIPPLLRRASILLQPGRPNEFNRLRLPSKLQAYLASGTPCITFAAGAGELLRDREEVLKTYDASPSELADRIVELLADPELRRTLSAGGPAAARRLFDPVRNTDALEAHYRARLERARD